MRIEIESVNNGYVITTQDTIRSNGVKVYKNTEEMQLLEDIGLLLVDRKVKAEITCTMP